MCRSRFNLPKLHEKSNGDLTRLAIYAARRALAATDPDAKMFWDSARDETMWVLQTRALGDRPPLDLLIRVAP